MNIRVRWQKLEEDIDETRVLHTDYRMPNFSVLTQAGLIPAGLLSVSDEAKELHSQIMAIHGVSNAVIDGYFIVIAKGAVFEWDEITPRVEQVLQKFTNADSIIHGDLIRT